MLLNTTDSYTYNVDNNRNDCYRSYEALVEQLRTTVHSTDVQHPLLYIQVLRHGMHRTRHKDGYSYRVPPAGQQTVRAPQHDQNFNYWALYERTREGLGHLHGLVMYGYHVQVQRATSLPVSARRLVDYLLTLPV